MNVVHRNEMRTSMAEMEATAGPMLAHLDWSGTPLRADLSRVVPALRPFLPIATKMQHSKIAY